MENPKLFPRSLKVITLLSLCISGTMSIPPFFDGPYISSPEEQGYLVPGIHKESLPQPIFYESFIPLILEYQTPQWNKTEVTFNNWYTCLTETAPYRYSCPVVFHMNQAIMNLHIDFEGLHPVTDKENEETSSQFYFDQLTTSSEFCNKIQKHFGGIYTQSSQLEKYLTALGNCQWDSGVQPLVERSIAAYNYSVRYPFTRMENNFYNTFYKNIVAGENGSNSNTTNKSSASTVVNYSGNSLDLVASALLSNARTTLQGAILGVYYAEKNRWVHANQDCLNQVIPQSIVTQAKFNESLIKILNLKSFKNKENDLSIGLGSISKYYSLPLTDCSHTSGNSLVVRVLIPILKKNRAKSLELIHVHNIPFQYKGNVCKLKLTPEDQHQHPEGFFQEAHGSHFIYKEISGAAFPTDCRANQLCKVSEDALTSRNSDLCVSALFSNNHVGIRGHCHFQCKKQDVSDNNPIVTRIHSNKYIITGSPTNVTISCRCVRCSKGRLLRIFNIGPETIGSHEVVLPCNCQMVLNKNIYYGEGPCSNDTKNVSVRPIIPFHFGKVKPTKNSPNGPVVPGEGFYYEMLQQGTLVNLADYVDLDRIQNYLKSGGGGGGGSHRSEGSEAAEKLTLESQGSSSVSSLWIVFIITTIVLFSVQIYILYLLRKVKNFSYPKDDRILYKVPDSPVMY